jgi:Na+-driven multidrug efflux pump
MVIQGAFRGAGQTKVAMALSLMSRWVFRVPTAIALAFSVTVAVPGTDIVLRNLGLDVGVTGIWAAFSIGAFLSFLVAVFWFRLGRWTEGVLDESEQSGERGDPAAATHPTPAADEVDD